MFVLTTMLAAHGAPEMIPEEATSILGRTAPDFTLDSSEAAPFTLSEHRGRPVVLAFWASWCGPCRLELPALDRFQDQHPEVTIVAVNVDRAKGPAEAFLQRLGGVDLPVVWDHESTAMGQFGVWSMPTSILVDGNGTVKLFKVGYGEAKGLAELEEALEKLK